MKKLISLALALLMATMCAGALAEIAIEETASEFDLTLPAIEGATVTQELAGSMSIVRILYDDPAKPDYLMNVAYSDIVEGKSLSEFGDEDIAWVYAMISGEMTSPVCETKDLDDGVRVAIAYDKGMTMANVLTIVKGYFIEMHVDFDSGAALSMGDIDLAVTLMDSVKIKAPVEKTAD